MANFFNSDKGEKWGFAVFFTILTALINGLDLYAGNGLVQLNLWQAIQESKWNNIAFFPFRAVGGYFSLILFLFILWSFSSQLESDMGSIKFLAYLLFGYFFLALGTIFSPISASHITFSIWAAIAWSEPDTEILFLFILPVKIKWLFALVSFAFFISIAFEAYDKMSFDPFLSFVLAYLNFVIFHAKEMSQRLVNR